MSEYIGSRIVPKPCGEWDKTKEYEVLSVVFLPSSGDSYIARKDTPAGTEITDEEYWMLCSEFNAQLKALSDTVSAINSSVTKLTAQVAANVSASTDSDADYAAEVVDARTLLSGAVKASLGEALRTVDKYATTYNAVSKSLSSYVMEDEDGNSLITLSDVIEAGLYVISTGYTIQDKPDDISYTPTALIVLPFRLADSNGVFTIQILCTVTGAVDTWYWRTRTTSAWTDWVRFSPDLSGYVLTTALANYLPLSSIVSTTGSNTDKVLSQYALTELNNGFPKSATSYRDTDDDGELVTDDDGKYTVTLSNILSPGSYVLNDQWSVTDAPDDISYTPTALVVQKFQTSISSTGFTIQWLGSVTKSVDVSWYWRSKLSSGSFSDWQRITPDLSGYALSSALDSYALKTALDSYLPAANVVSAQGTNTDKVISQNYLTSYANAFGKSSAGYYAVDEDGEYVLDDDGKKQITLGDITSPGYYIISDTLTVTDKPDGISYKPTAMIVQHLQSSSSTTFTLQWLGSCTPPSTAITWYWRSLLSSGSWSSWQRVTPDLSGYTTASDVEEAIEEAMDGITQEVNNNTYEITKVTNQYSNTYEVACTPEITTDTNNYLAATGDKTDMAASIAAMLEETGVCHLGPGNFYTTGVDMPDNTTVTGCGRATRVYLLSSVEDGYVFRMGSGCTIADMSIYGNTSHTVSEEVGSRHGILFEGEADADTVTYTTQRGTVENVHIWYCDGGGITCYDTGYSHGCSLNVSDCVIIGCDAGINISYWSEYHRFNNCNCYSNYYGCINNGGNNMFSNCCFTGNKLGFLMDNTEGDQRNTAHGSANGCVFNHTDSNNGTGIKIINMANGFIFTGGQIFYSAIELENASGVVFEAMNCGRAEVVNITGCKTILFDHCIYGSAPVVTVDDDSTVVEFTDCYVRSTGAAVSI